MITAFLIQTNGADDLLIRKDGSYDFSYANPDSFHESQANRNNVVRGKFGGRNPKTGPFIESFVSIRFNCLLVLYLQDASIKFLTRQDLEVLDREAITS